MSCSIYILLYSIFVMPTNVVFAVELENLIGSNSEESCRIINEDYFKVMKQFYGSVNLISLYFIHPNKPNASSFELSNDLLSQIPKSNFSDIFPFHFEFRYLYFFTVFSSGMNCSVTYQVIDTECGCVKLSANRMKFVNILRSDMQSGIFIVTENIFSIERILFRLPAYLSDIRRRKAIILITNTTDSDFDSLSDGILVKFWKQVKLANVILITPCNHNLRVCKPFVVFICTQKYVVNCFHSIFHRLFGHIFLLNS